MQSPTRPADASSPHVGSLLTVFFSLDARASCLRVTLYSFLCPEDLANLDRTNKRLHDHSVSLCWAVEDVSVTYSEPDYDDY